MCAEYALAALQKSLARVIVIVVWLVGRMNDLVHLLARPMSHATPITLERLTNAQIAPLEAELPTSFPEVLREFATSFYITLLNVRDLPLPVAARTQLAIELARGVSRDLGGMQPYIPSSHKARVEGLHDAIVREFNGRNHDALARKYGIGPRQVRRILCASRS